MWSERGIRAWEESWMALPGELGTLRNVARASRVAPGRENRAITGLPKSMGSKRKR